MEADRAVPTAEGQALAQEYGIKFYECSAKQDLNVEKAFVSVGREVKDRLISDGHGTGGAGAGAGAGAGGAGAQKLTAKQQTEAKPAGAGGCCK